MNPPQKRQWLARNGEVHGPYELAYLLDLHQKAQLVSTDSFCAEGEESWISYSDWRATHAPPPPQKRTVISAKGGASANKTGRLKLPQPALLASLPRAKKTPAAGANAPAQEAVAPGAQDPQKRLFRLAEVLNDHRRAHPHRHPFYFAEPQHLGDVTTWLDAHHKGWDAAMLLPGTSPAQEVLHQWFIPAVALVKPDLVKPSHRSDFGEGRPWRSLEEP
jgi:hypothetical protein